MYNVLNEFDEAANAIINPSDFVKPVPGFPEICVSTFSKSIVEKYANMRGTEIIAHIHTANGQIPVYRMNYSGKNIAFYLSLPSAPACVSCFEEIVAMGAKKFVLFGCGGVLDTEIVEGHLIVPTSAVRDEGTSYHYLPPSEEIDLDPHSISVLTTVLESFGYPYVKGKVWTMDAIYRETAAKMERRKQQGCIIVEMECAAVAAAAKFRNIPFLQFLYSADNLDSAQWEPRDLADYGLTNAEKYMALAFECGLQL